MGQEINLRIKVDGSGNVVIDQTTVAIRKAGDEAEKTSTRSKKAAADMDNAFKSVTGTVLRLATAVAAGQLLKDFNSIEERVRAIGRQGNLSAAGVAALKQQVLDIGEATSQGPDVLLGAIEKIIAKTGDIKLAAEAIEAVARAAEASGASAVDLGAIAADLSQKFGIFASNMGRAFDILYAQGKAGSFELKDMASNGERLFTAAANMGLHGEGGLRIMGALLQIIRQATGSAEEATTAWENLAKDLIVNADKIEQTLGVQVWANAGHTALRSIDVLMKDIIQKSGGQLDVLVDLFDIRSFRAVSALNNSFKKFGDFRELDDLIKKGGDLSGTMKDAANRGDELTAALTNLKTSAIETLNSYVGLIKYATEFVKTVGDNTAAVVALAVAFGLAWSVGKLITFIGWLDKLGLKLLAIIKYIPELTTLGSKIGAFAGVAGAWFAGWEIGRFLGQLKIAGKTLDEWVQRGYAKLFFDKQTFNDNKYEFAQPGPGVDQKYTSEFWKGDYEGFSRYMDAVTKRQEAERAEANKTATEIAALEEQKVQATQRANELMDKLTKDALDRIQEKYQDAFQVFKQGTDERAKIDRAYYSEVVNWAEAAAQKEIDAAQRVVDEKKRLILQEIADRAGAFATLAEYDPAKYAGMAADASLAQLGSDEAVRRQLALLDATQKQDFAMAQAQKTAGQFFPELEKGSWQAQQKVQELADTFMGYVEAWTAQEGQFKLEFEDMVTDPLNAIQKRLEEVTGKVWQIQVELTGSGAGVASARPASGVPGTPPVEGSHAGGIDYIPRDMTVRVHKEEAMLSPQDAREWREFKASGGRSASGVSIGAMTVEMSGNWASLPSSQETREWVRRTLAPELEAYYGR
ncbi:MAG: phage tail tape measure protein [Nitrospirae bacterium]|nr:phage tail tape measure protein [Nitrospirota bacterium]